MGRGLVALCLVLAGCGARTGLEVAPLERDAGPGDAGTDAQPPRWDERDAGPPPECPTPPCDCELRGHLAWSDVAVCAYSGPLTLTSCLGWEDPMELSVSCSGRYTVCARVESRSGCVIEEVCTSRNSAGGVAWLSMPGFSSRNECAVSSIDEHGGRVCVRVSWRGAGRAERELGCFAEFGPWCIGPRCGGGGGGELRGDDGVWEL